MFLIQLLPLQMNGTYAIQIISDNNVQERLMLMALIAGGGIGGIGGLMLGALFERINIPHHIFECATELRSLGNDAP